MFPVDLLVGSLRQSSGWWRVAHLVLTLPALTRISDRLIFYQPPTNQQLIKYCNNWKNLEFPTITWTLHSPPDNSFTWATSVIPRHKQKFKFNGDQYIYKSLGPDFICRLTFYWYLSQSIIDGTIFIGLRKTIQIPAYTHPPKLIRKYPDTPQLEYGWVIANML